MTAVILAAGTGSRLRPLTDALPKCLIPVGGRSILQRTIENLLASGIEEILIVTGYRSDQIHDSLLPRFHGISLRFIVNTLFESTNNIYSLWLALQKIHSGPLMLLDSDIVFDRRILDLLLRSGHESCLAINSRHAMGEEEVKVRTGPDGAILAIGKEMPPGAAAGESIGIERFGEKSAGELRSILDSMIVKEGRMQLFYEAAFQKLIDDGGRLYAVDVGDLYSLEIDTVDDLERARQSLGG